jgi:hypothetical protein
VGTAGMCTPKRLASGLFGHRQADSDSRERRAYAVCLQQRRYVLGTPAANDARRIGIPSLAYSADRNCPESSLVHACTGMRLILARVLKPADCPAAHMPWYGMSVSVRTYWLQPTTLPNRTTSRRPGPESRSLLQASIWDASKCILITGYYAVYSGCCAALCPRGIERLAAGPGQAHMQCTTSSSREERHFGSHTLTTRGFDLCLPHCDWVIEPSVASAALTKAAVLANHFKGSEPPIVLQMTKNSAQTNCGN